MKKFLFLSIIVLLASCTKPVTSYQIYNSTTKSTSAYDPYLNGTLYEVVVYCYVGSDIVRQDNYTQISCGETTDIKEVPENFTKIQVSFKMLPPESQYYNLSSNNRLYVKSFTLIEESKNVVAEINENTMVSNSMTIKQNIKLMKTEKQ